MRGGQSGLCDGGGLKGWDRSGTGDVEAEGVRLGTEKVTREGEDVVVGVAPDQSG